MALRIRLDDLSLVGDLGAFFERAGFQVSHEDDATIAVFRLRGLKETREQEADRVETIRLLGDWCADHPGVKPEVLR